MPFTSHTTHQAFCGFCPRAIPVESKSYPDDWTIVTAIRVAAESRSVEPAEYIACPDCTNRMFDEARPESRF